jgi:hypothetical protein
MNTKKLDDVDIRQLYRTAWEHWGAYSQIDIAIEEMAELTQALLKARRNGQHFSSSGAVLEEMADTAICLEQLLEQTERNEKTDEYMKYKNDKLLRLESRLMESMAKKYPQEIAGELI